jgi:Flp pilus assembly pilin Flp
MRRLPASFARSGEKTALGRAFLSLLRDSRGVTAIEYTLIIVLIVMALVALITQIGDFVSTPFNTLASYL